MRVTIWADMEGMAGILAWEQVDPGSPLYDEGRRLLTNEVNAAVRGAKKAGADEIIVIDCHGAGGEFKFKSLLTNELEPGAEYVLGAAWMRYVEPLEQGCDAALCIGAHAMAGTPDGVLCHTVSSQSWYNFWINDVLVGETGICAALCGHFDCPVVMVAGDEATGREARALLGDEIVTVATKRSLSRFAIRSLAPADACAKIELAAAEAILRRHRVRPFKPATPTTLTVELATPDRAAEFLGRTGVERAGDRRLIARGDDFYQAWDRFWHRM